MFSPSNTPLLVISTGSRTDTYLNHSLRYNLYGLLFFDMPVLRSITVSVLLLLWRVGASPLSRDRMTRRPAADPGHSLRYSPTAPPIGACHPRPQTYLPTTNPTATPSETNPVPTGEPTGEPSSMPSNEPTDQEQNQGLLANPHCPRIISESQRTEDLCPTLQAIKEEFLSITSSAGNNFKAHLFGASLRLCFHDAGEVLVSDMADSMGPDGCLQTINSDNAGLSDFDGAVNLILEPIWQRFCDKISRADSWAFWGKLVVESAASSPIEVNFYAGRSDSKACDAGVGRLPVASALGLGEIHRVFINQMGLSLQDAVTLIGAHTLGHMSPKTSGFGLPPSHPNGDSIDFNAWDLSSWSLDNGFFQALLGAEWQVLPESTENKQCFTASPEMPLVMLNSDISLAYALSGNDLSRGILCGRHHVCDRQLSTLDIVNRYASDNSLFVKEFAKSFTKMCNVGYSYVFNDEVFTGKLGTLSSVECPGGGI